MSAKDIVNWDTMYTLPVDIVSKYTLVRCMSGLILALCPLPCLYLVPIANVSHIAFSHNRCSNYVGNEWTLQTSSHKTALQPKNLQSDSDTFTHACTCWHFDLCYVPLIQVLGVSWLSFQRV